MLAELNRNLIWSAQYNWHNDQRIKREVMCQWALVFQKVLRNFMKSFWWATKCLLQTEVNVERNNLSDVLWCSYRQYCHRKANTKKLCGKSLLLKIKYNLWKRMFAKS